VGAALCAASAGWLLPLLRTASGPSISAAAFGTSAGHPLPVSSLPKRHVAGRWRSGRRPSASRGALPGALTEGASMFRAPFQADGSWPPPTAVELQNLASEVSDVPVLDATDMRPPLQLEGPRRLQGLIGDWPLLQMDALGLVDHLGDLELRLRPCSTIHEFGFSGPTVQQVSLKDYIANSSLAHGHVVYENDFQPVHHRLRKSCEVPQLLQAVHGRPVFSAGAQHTGIGFHRHNESWLAQLHGRKTWLLLPPSATRPPSLPPWWSLAQRPLGLRACTLEPGEVLYLPENWWHATWNLDNLTLGVGWEGGTREWTANMHAIADGNAAKVDTTEYPTPPMVWLAARTGHAEIVRLLIEEDADLTLRADASPAVIAAARGGHMAILELLKGYNSKFRPDQAGRNALHIAAQSGHAPAVEWLLEQGAPLNALDAEGSDATLLAATNGQPQVLEKMLSLGGSAISVNTRGTGPLPSAAFNGHAAAAEILLRANADPCAQDSLQMTPLHLAAIRGHAAVAEVLLAGSADAAIVDHAGRTPLHLAAWGYEDPDDPENGFKSARDANMAVTAALLSARADFGIADSQGSCPLDYATSRGHFGVAQLLTRAAVSSTVVERRSIPDSVAPQPSVVPEDPSFDGAEIPESAELAWSRAVAFLEQATQQQQAP